MKKEHLLYTQNVKTNTEIFQKHNLHFPFIQVVSTDPIIYRV